nr:variable surface lipoprotein [Mycoplasmopsis bovis]
MKKSKFLLLGSVASLASIPFVAAKCGETKEEEKKKKNHGKKRTKIKKNRRKKHIDKNTTNKGEKQTENTKIKQETLKTP